MSSTEGNLRFETTVDRDLVHRSAVAEVFVTDSAFLGDDRFVVAAQLPRSYGYYNDSPLGHYDPLLVMESIRQGTVLATHRYYQVPRDHAFVVRSIDLHVTDVSAHRIGDRPGRLLTEVQVSQKEYRSGVLAALTTRADSTIDGSLSSTGSGTLSVMSPSVYRRVREISRLRKAASPASSGTVARPADPACVGRHDRRNVVITALRPGHDDSSVACDLVVDTTHPTLFDHPVDHVPGMLLLEAYRQAAHAAVSTRSATDPTAYTVTRCSGLFLDFAELNLPATCTAMVGRTDRPTIAVDLAVRQAGVIISTGRVEITTGRVEITTDR